MTVVASRGPACNKPPVLATLWLLAVACDGADPSSWTRPEDCEGLGPARVADECRAAVAPEVFRQDLAAGERWVGDIQDVLIRDYAWLSVTREVDLRGKRYCERIETPELRERCDTLVSRPHLLQQLQKGDGPPGKGQQGPGGPGRPPPGGEPGPEGPKAPH